MAKFRILRSFYYVKNCLDFSGNDFLFMNIELAEQL